MFKIKEQNNKMWLRATLKDSEHVAIKLFFYHYGTEWILGNHQYLLSLFIFFSSRFHGDIPGKCQATLKLKPNGSWMESVHNRATLLPFWIEVLTLRCPQVFFTHTLQAMLKKIKNSQNLNKVRIENLFIFALCFVKKK